MLFKVAHAMLPWAKAQQPRAGIYRMQSSKHPPLLQQKGCILTKILQAILSKCALKSKQGTHSSPDALVKLRIYTWIGGNLVPPPYINDKNKLHNYED